MQYFYNEKKIIIEVFQRFNLPPRLLDFSKLRIVLSRASSESSSFVSSKAMHRQKSTMMN